MSTQSYQPVAQDEGQEKGQNVILEPVHKGQRRKAYIIVGIVTAVLAILLCPAIVLHRAQLPRWTSCGKSPSTARERGCSFDLISFAWQTKECYDSSLVSDFANWDSWVYYLDAQSNVTISQDVAFEGETDVLTTWKFHQVHCTFMWRQMHRAFEAGWIDSHLRSYNHTLHCQKMLLMRPEKDDVIAANATIIYPTCESVRKASGSSWWDAVYSG